MSDESQIRILDWLTGVATLVGITMASWSLISTVDHENRIGRIEETKYTREDAANDKAAIIKEMQTPPKWVVDRLDMILEATRNNAEKIEEINEKIDRSNP